MPEVPSQVPRMHIAVAPRTNPVPGQIKVTLSSAMRIKLHSHKHLTGVTIAETVQEALEVYFQEAHARANEAAETPSTPEWIDAAASRARGDTP